MMRSYDSIWISPNPGIERRRRLAAASDDIRPDASASAAALVGLHIPVAALLVDPVADQIPRALELLRPGVARDETRGLPHHVELAVRAHLADQHRLGDVV